MPRVPTVSLLRSSATPISPPAIRAATAGTAPRWPAIVPSTPHSVRGLDQHAVAARGVAPDPLRSGRTVRHQLGAGRLRHRLCPFTVDDAYRVEDFSGSLADAAVPFFRQRAELAHLAQHRQ